MNIGTENKEHHNLFSYLSPKQQNMIQKDFINNKFVKPTHSSVLLFCKVANPYGQMKIEISHHHYKRKLC